MNDPNTASNRAQRRTATSSTEAQGANGEREHVEIRPLTVCISRDPTEIRSEL
jgi:hypothetical protein